MRFQALMHMATVTFDHYHNAAGEIVSGPPPNSRGPLFGLKPSDDDIFRRIAETTEAKLDQLNNTSSQLIAAARRTGVRPEQQKLNDLEAQRQAALKTALFDLRNQVSPEGWKTIETQMMQMGISAVRVGMPAK